jgi:hypothetical protein
MDYKLTMGESDVKYLHCKNTVRILWRNFCSHKCWKTLRMWYDDGSTRRFAGINIAFVFAEDISSRQHILS